METMAQVTAELERETRWDTIWTRRSSDAGEEKHTKLMGVELAPIDIPWERRMQTFAVTFWIWSFFFGGFTCLFLVIYMTFYTSFFWLSTLYIAWAFYDRHTPERGGRRFAWTRNVKLWQHFAKYFPIRLVKTANLDSSKNYLFASHPHGIVCSGAFCCFATSATGFDDKFPGLTSHLLTLNLQFKFPFYRDYVMSGGTCAASRDGMNYLLSHPKGGQVAVIVPGGAAESLDAHPGLEIVLHLKNRKGFVKVALQNGVSLVPVFCFGETDVYDQVPNKEGSTVRKIQNRLQKLMSFAPIILLGRGVFQYTFGIVPHRRPVNVVVGGPIPCVKIENPSQEDVNRLHQKYIESLTALFEKYKGKYGNENSYLKFV